MEKRRRSGDLRRSCVLGSGLLTPNRIILRNQDVKDFVKKEIRSSPEMQMKELTDMKKRKRYDRRRPRNEEEKGRKDSQRRRTERK